MILRELIAGAVVYALIGVCVGAAVGLTVDFRDHANVTSKTIAAGVFWPLITIFVIAKGAWLLVRDEAR